MKYKTEDLEDLADIIETLGDYEYDQLLNELGNRSRK